MKALLGTPEDRANRVGPTLLAAPELAAFAAPGGVSGRLRSKSAKRFLGQFGLQQHIQLTQPSGVSEEQRIRLTSLAVARRRIAIGDRLALPRWPRIGAALNRVRGTASAPDEDMLGERVVR